MKKMEASCFILLVACIGIVIGILIIEKYQPSLPSTFSPLLQELGKPVKSIDRAISKLMPIEDIDEQMLGEAIRKEFEQTIPKDLDPETIAYLTSLVQNLSSNTKKQFDYTIYLQEGYPNAYAFPGGIIVITKAFLDCLSNEAELIAILGHEIGHIERGHSFDSARSRMLRKKIKFISLFDFAIDTIESFSRHLFSKTQEDEADEYAFNMLLEKGYNPFAISDVFTKLSKQAFHTHNLLTDFFNSHPYEVLRRDKFHSRAESWLTKNPDTKMYIGKRNFEEKKSRYYISYSDEYDLQKTTTAPL